MFFDILEWTLMLALLCTIFVDDAHSAIYKWNDNDYRDAVDFIDMGHLKDGAYDLEFYTLVCVDGVKVYTVSAGSDSGGVYSIIIPGPCSGPASKTPGLGYKPDPSYVPTAPPPTPKKGGVTW